MTDCNHPSDDQSDSSTREGDINNDSNAQSPVEAFYFEYGPDDSPTEAILSAVSTVDGTEPTKMEPLYCSIDADALDILLDGPAVTGEDDTIEVEFQYSGYRIAVQNNGSVTLFDDDGQSL